MLEEKDVLFRCIFAILRDFSELRHSNVYFWYDCEKETARYSTVKRPDVDGLVFSVGRTEICDESGNTSEGCLLDVANDVYGFLQGEERRFDAGKDAGK